MICIYLCEIINFGIKLRNNFFAKWAPHWNDFSKDVIIWGTADTARDLEVQCFQ